MFNNDFVVTVRKKSIVVQADPETIQDISIVLDHLVSLVHSMRHKSRLAAIQAKREAERRQAIVTMENHDRALEIFKRYLVHLNNGCAGNKTKATQEIAAEYGLRMVDARFYVMHGRKVTKEAEKKKQCSLF